MLTTASRRRETSSEQTTLTHFERFVAPCLTELVQGPTGICGRDVEALEGCSGFLPPAAGDVEPNYTSVEMPRVRPPLSSRSASGEQICTLDNTSILRPKIWAQFGHNLGTIWGAVMTNLERNLGAIWAPGARKLGVEPRKRATQFGQAGRTRHPWANLNRLRASKVPEPCVGS